MSSGRWEFLPNWVLIQSRIQESVEVEEQENSTTFISSTIPNSSAQSYCKLITQWESYSAIMKWMKLTILKEFSLKLLFETLHGLQDIISTPHLILCIHVNFQVFTQHVQTILRPPTESPHTHTHTYSTMRKKGKYTLLSCQFN